MKSTNGVEIPYLFIGLFDGHGGSGAGIKVAKEMHQILHEGLEDVLPYMLNPDKILDPNDNNNKVLNNSKAEIIEEDLEDEDEDEDESEAVEVIKFRQTNFEFHDNFVTKTAVSLS